MQKEAIGKEIVIKIDRGIKVLSLKRHNACKQQIFLSDNLPEKLTFCLWGQEVINGQKYDKYVAKHCFVDFSIHGATGYLNLEKEAKKISQIFRGKCKDGRKIQKSRMLIIEDINQLLGLEVDFQKGRVYHEDTNFTIYSDEKLGESYNHNDVLFQNTYYHYSFVNLAKEKQREMIVESISYDLASIKYYVDENYVSLGPGKVDAKSNIALSGSFNSHDLSAGGECQNMRLRPVVFLEAEK